MLRGRGAELLDALTEDAVAPHPAVASLYELRDAALTAQLERLRDDAKAAAPLVHADPRCDRAQLRVAAAAPDVDRTDVRAYTHRIAISNRRIVAFDGKRVTFRWRDYADNSRPKLLTLDGHEFLRRFLLHVLPDRFVQSRYIGFLGDRHRAHNIAIVRERIRNLRTSLIRCRSSVPRAPPHEPRLRCRRERLRQSWRPRHEPDLSRGCQAHRPAEER